MAIRSVSASLLGLALVAGACSAPSEEADPLPVDIQVTSTTIPAELAFVDEADPDATLHLALTKPESWDPAAISMTNQDAVVMADLLYDGLTEASGATLRPGLANSWAANSDFTTWTFELDTDRVSPQQVIDSFDRLGKAQPNAAAVKLLDVVDSMSVSGDDTVVFSLNAPSAGFAWIVSGVQYSIVSEVGFSGRYDIGADTDTTTELTSDKVPDIDISWFDDGKATYYQLTLGQVDAAVVDPRESRDAANRLGQQPSARSVVRFYGMNLGSEDLADPLVREAVLLSIDKPSVLEELPMAGFQADGAAGASSAGFRYGACDLACIYNPETSRGLLSQAGVRPTLTIVYVGEDQAGVAQEIAASVRKGGFRTEVVETTAEELPALIADGTAEIFSYGWAAPAASMDAIVPPLFRSDSPLNAMSYSSVAVDEILAEAAITADDNARWELLDQAHRLALSDGTMIPVAVAHNGLVQSPDLSPLAIRPDGSLDVMSIQ